MFHKVYINLATAGAIMARTLDIHPALVLGHLILIWCLILRSPPP